MEWKAFYQRLEGRPI